MTRRVGTTSLSILLALCVTSAGCHSTPNDRTQGALTPTTPKTEPWTAEYDQLAKEIDEYNGPPPIQVSAWEMNIEHLFPGDLLDPNILRNRVIRFIRMPGALNGLFKKLASPQTPPQTVLVIAEMLVFYGQYHVARDEAIKAPAAEDVDQLLKHGAFADLDKKFDAPIQLMLSYSVDKARGRRGPYIPTEDQWTKGANGKAADESK